MFIVDDSHCLADSYNFNSLKSFFVGSLVLSIDIGGVNGLRVGLVTIGDQVRPKFSLGDQGSREDVFAAVMALTYIGGGKNTSDALRYVRQTLLATSTPDRNKIGMW